MTINLAYAADEELELISPLGAVIRSSLLPGYGQVYTGKKVQGVVSFITTCSFLTSSFIVRSSYKDIYYNKYIPAANENLYSPETSDYYNQANQKYKLSQFFLFTGLGFWAYSLIDSYVEANFYNAELKADRLLKENVELKVSMIGQQINLELETTF